MREIAKASKIEVLGFPGDEGETGSQESDQPAWDGEAGRK